LLYFSLAYCILTFASCLSTFSSLALLTNASFSFHYANALGVFILIKIRTTVLFHLTNATKVTVKKQTKTKNATVKIRKCNRGFSQPLGKGYK